MESYVDTSRVSIRPIYKPLAKDIIEKNHYSGRLSSCRYPLGIFYQTDNQHQFFDEAEEKLIGVACYGFPVGRRVIGSIFKEEILENKNILYNATLAAHDQFVNTLTDAEMHGAERRKKIEEAVKNSAIRFLGEHTKAFIKKKMQEVAFENATNQIKLGSQKATALKSFLIDKGKAFGSVIASMAEASAKMIAAAGPFALIAAPAIIAAVGALGSALKSQIESGQGALGFADGGIVPGANRGQGDTVPAMLTPGELILNVPEVVPSWQNSPFKYRFCSPFFTETTI